MPLRAALARLGSRPSTTRTEYLTHGQIIRFGDEELEVRFTRPCAWTRHLRPPPRRQVFGGDTLFQGSIGRFDLPGADGPALLASIQSNFSLPDDYAVHPGHGLSTTIGEERISNPFVGEHAAGF